MCLTVQRVVSFTQYVRNLIPLRRPLQYALKVGTDVNMTDVIQEHPYNTANQMCKPGHRHKVTELKETEKSEPWRDLLCVCVCILHVSGCVGSY